MRSHPIRMSCQTGSRLLRGGKTAWLRSSGASLTSPSLASLPCLLRMPTWLIRGRQSQMTVRGNSSIFIRLIKLIQITLPLNLSIDMSVTFRRAMMIMMRRVMRNSRLNWWSPWERKIFRVLTYSSSSCTSPTKLIV